MRHQPKGSMCISCKHAERDCSNVDFSFYPPLMTYTKEQITVVRCGEYEKRHND